MHNASIVRSRSLQMVLKLISKLDVRVCLASQGMTVCLAHTLVGHKDVVFACGVIVISHIG